MKRHQYLALALSTLLLGGCGGSSSGGGGGSSSEEPYPDETNDGTETVDQTQTQQQLSIQNEPYYPYAWHLKSTDSFFNQVGYAIDPRADVNVTSAWEITRGEGVKVAVIDDYFDVTHEDLQANVWKTYNVDNDSNDVTNPIPLEEAENGSHGNTCAGFIVSPVNGKGAMGVAPEAKLIAISLSSSYDSDTIKAFEYAKNQGAQVISCSWGSENVSEAIVSELQSLYEAGITVLFASGNDGKNLDASEINDESEIPWVIGVGASGENNDVTVYSNYGSNIDLLAPGGDTDYLGILGIDDTGERGSSLQYDIVSNSYAFTNGTSFATPVAAGVAALMYSVNPGLKPEQVRTILIDTADKIGTSANYDAEGFDTMRAFGKVNAGKAVAAAQALNKAP